MEGFTYTLAAVDFITCFVFSLNAFLIARKFNSWIFVLGAIISFIAGCGKVIWKVIIAKKNKRIDIFFYQFRVLMPLGFILMLLGILKSEVTISKIIEYLVSLPEVIFFVLAILTMIALIIMASKMDKTNSRDNWIEQITNIVAQCFILVGLLLG